jgi:hypothetical protein
MTTSCEKKLRTLAMADATLQADLGTAPFLWFDMQLAQGQIGAPSDNKTCITVQRISTIRMYNQGGITPLSQVRLQINVVDYSAERARIVASHVADFMGTIDLTDAGDFPSVHAPNFLLNERADMLALLSPAAYVTMQDWRCWVREDLN